VIVVAAEVAETDRQRIEGYLAHKWGLEWRLPIDHPYRSAPPVEENCGDSLIAIPETNLVPAPGTAVPVEVQVSFGDGPAEIWSASTSSAWLAVVDSAAGDPSSGFALSALPNPGLSPRVATVSVESDSGAVSTFEIRQAAPCEHVGGPDCDNDGISDLCAILWGLSTDGDADGVPDDCGTSCPEDLNGDLVVDGADLTMLLAAWGEPTSNAADLDGNGVVDGADLAMLLAAWSEACSMP
jgi:hypothetical protein